MDGSKYDKYSHLPQVYIAGQCIYRSLPIHLYRTK